MASTLIGNAVSQNANLGGFAYYVPKTATENGLAEEIRVDYIGNAGLSKVGVYDSDGVRLWWGSFTVTSYSTNYLITIDEPFYMFDGDYYYLYIAQTSSGAVSATTTGTSIGLQYSPTYGASATPPADLTDVTDWTSSGRIDYGMRVDGTIGLPPSGLFSPLAMRTL